jgi:hypothetical protein
MARRPARPSAVSAETDDIARLTLDLAATDEGELRRLRGLLTATATRGAGTIGRAPRGLAGIEVGAALRERIEGGTLGRADTRKPPILAARRDLGEDLVAGRVAGPLTALGGAERLGPFSVDDRPVFFDIWRKARQIEVIEQGAAAPAFVISSGRRPTFSLAGATTLDVQKGTIWIRGDLVDGSLPAGAYVGATVSDGKLALPSVTSQTDDRVEIAAPVKATLTLILEAEEIAPTTDACTAGVKLDLPKITLTFGLGGMTVEGDSGRAEAWGQTFDFGAPTGTVTFVLQLWTLLLGYKVEPDSFDGSAIGGRLAEFQGKAKVTGAALALPVVQAAPAALGPAAVAPGFWMALQGLEARWYAPDERFHVLDPWLALTNRGTALLDIDVAPLARPVETTYRLWALPDTGGRRLPWRHDYRASFLFFHRCDAEQGESLMATGTVKLALDRPVAANGRPVRTPTETGAILLTAKAGGIRAMLGAGMKDPEDTRLVLRNALVWATGADMAIAESALTDRQMLDDGTLALRFGVYAWTPTLPDPYVGNFHICRPDINRPRAILGALVRWTAAGAPQVAFTGDMGLPMVCPSLPSAGDPVPAPRSDLNPDVGLTQTEQGQLGLGERALGELKKAQAREQQLRGRRVAKAIKLNQASTGAIDGQLRERLGPTPPVFLLDVSTNQDLLGVALWGVPARDQFVGVAGGPPTSAAGGGFPVQALDVNSTVEAMRLVTLPQIQWEPVRTLDEDQDILTLGWFPTPLASATDGGATVLGARSQKLAPVIPEPLLTTTKEVFDDGTNVTFRTTLPFGIVTVVDLKPTDDGPRKADSYEITQPDFPAEAAKGALQITAKAEGGREKPSEVSPYFRGATRQMINGVDLATGAALGLSVLSSTGDPAGDVETIFNNDMAANPKVPVTRFDLSGYGGSNFSKWENPFALFAETAKTQFQVMTGRTALEIIKVASVLHPWGIKVTRSVIVERRSGGGVIRRDTGWQATSPGLLDYRYVDKDDPAPDPQVADYAFDSGIFKGLFNVRTIRPAPGIEFSSGGATFVPYYFDADLALEGLSGRVPANGVLGWLQTQPNGDPASAAALRALIEAQGAPGGPIDTWIDFGASKLPFRARRIEMDVVDDAGKPLFVATVRGVPKLPKTGAWSVVQRPVAAVPPGGGEAVPVSETKGVPIVRRHAVKYPAGSDAAFAAPPRDASLPLGPWRMADPVDLLTPAAPQNDYCLLQSTPTHGFLFPRPQSGNSGAARVTSTMTPELADILARSTSKGAFPPPQNAITLPAPMHFDVGSTGSLALSAPVTVVNYPVPLRLAGSQGHGSELTYEDSTLQMTLDADKWSAEFNGLTLWSDIAGLERASGAKLRIVGSTDQRPQVAEIDTLVYEPVEKILTFIPVFGARDKLGPIDLGASNAKHEIKIVIETIQEVPKEGFSIGGAEIKLLLGAGGSTGWDVKTGGVKAAGKLMAGVKAEFPILSGGVASVYIIVQLDVKFSIASVVGVVTEEKLELVAFAGIGVKGEIGPFKAYAYLGIGFVFIYDFTSGTPKFGGLVRFEAGVDLKIVKVKLLAELKGVVYSKIEALPPPASGSTEKTYCDYSGKVKLQVDIFLIISISATYTVSDTKALS